MSSHKMLYVFFLLNLVIFLPSQSFAEDEKDLFLDYNTDIRKPADAKATNVYNAWGENMAKLIESGYRDGVVVDRPGEYAGGKIRADGAGNVVVDRYTNVGPIINKPKFENSTVIIKDVPQNNLTRRLH